MQHVTVDDVRIPALGLGTARMSGEECTRAVETALDIGYRHVDTAQMYGNEAAVAEGIAASSVDRDDVFLVTKVNTGNLRREETLSSTRESLDRLDTDYIDLLLIHAPRDYAPIPETIDAMNELQSEGLVEHIGVSNFSTNQLDTAIEASDTPIVTNQVEYHPFTDQSELLTACSERDVSLTAYSPLDKGRVTDHDVLRQIGEDHDKTPAQVTLRWLLQQDGVVAIPKAADEDHLRENLDVFDFEVTDEELRRIFDIEGSLTRHLRELLGL